MKNLGLVFIAVWCVIMVTVVSVLPFLSEKFTWERESIGITVTLLSVTIAWIISLSVERIWKESFK